MTVDGVVSPDWRRDLQSVTRWLNAQEPFYEDNGVEQFVVHNGIATGIAYVFVVHLIHFRNLERR